MPSLSCVYRNYFLLHSAENPLEAPRRFPVFLRGWLEALDADLGNGWVKIFHDGDMGA